VDEYKRKEEKMAKEIEASNATLEKEIEALRIKDAKREEEQKKYEEKEERIKNGGCVITQCLCYHY